jgi:hypothetical protein
MSQFERRTDPPSSHAPQARTSGTSQDLPEHTRASTTNTDGRVEGGAAQVSGATTDGR